MTANGSAIPTAVPRPDTELRRSFNQQKRAQNHCDCSTRSQNAERRELRLKHK